MQSSGRNRANDTTTELRFDMHKQQVEARLMSKAKINLTTGCLDKEGAGLRCNVNGEALSPEYIHRTKSSVRSQRQTNSAMAYIAVSETMNNEGACNVRKTKAIFTNTRGTS